MSGDNGGSKWIWHDRMDAMLSETTKANGVLETVDQGVPVPGIYVVPVEVEDDGPNEDVPPASTVQTTNLSGVRGTLAKRDRISRDMYSALDHFAES